MIEISFDDINTNVVDLSNGPNAVLCLDRRTAQSLEGGIRTISESDIEEFKNELFIPLACTFTFPDETTVGSMVTNKKGNLVKKYIPLEKATFEVQKYYMRMKISSWILAVNKLLPKTSPIIMDEIQFELTKKNRIHAHGLFWTDNNYYRGVTDIMTVQWVRISKGKFCAQSKKGISGHYDKAFDKCNNVESWRKYMRKELMDKKEPNNEI